MELQEVLLAKEEQEELLRRRERELTALKGALKEEVAAHDQEVDKMKEQYEKEMSRLQASLAEAKQVISSTFVPPPPLLQSDSPCSSSSSGDKLHIRGAVAVCVLHCELCHMFAIGGWGDALK